MVRPKGIYSKSFISVDALTFPSKICSATILFCQCRRTPSSSWEIKAPSPLLCLSTDAASTVSMVSSSPVHHWSYLLNPRKVSVCLRRGPLADLFTSCKCFWEMETRTESIMYTQKCEWTKEIEDAFNRIVRCEQRLWAGKRPGDSYSSSK